MIVSSHLQKFANFDRPQVLLVLDPVMITATGHRLIDEEAVLAITKDLLPRARAFKASSVWRAHIEGGSFSAVMKQVYFG